MRLRDDQSQELLEDLEISQRESLGGARELASLRVQTGIEVRPANVCDRGTLVGAGQTTELRRRVTTCIVDQPPAVGSMFHLTFAQGQIDLEPVLAICERCTMLSDSAFEARFLLVDELDLTSLEHREK